MFFLNSSISNEPWSSSNSCSNFTSVSINSTKLKGVLQDQPYHDLVNFYSQILIFKGYLAVDNILN